MATPEERIRDTEVCQPPNQKSGEAQRSAPESSRSAVPLVEEFHVDRGRTVIVRTVRRRDGSRVASEIPLGGLDIAGHDLGAAYDRAWLRSPKEPKLRGRRRTVRTVDLFSGCGGLTVGVAEACRALGARLEPLLAVDIDSTALDVYQQNIPARRTVPEPIETILNSDLGAPLSSRERRLKQELGHVDIVMGGPPCQGHSDLNNHTRRADPKNALYARMARFAEVCEPAHIIIENVNGVRHDNGAVFERTRDYLGHLGYHVDGRLLRAEVVGVPQSRPRVLLIASKKVCVTVEQIAELYRTGPRDFGWACGDLNMDQSSAFDRPSTPKAVTKERIDYLFDHDLYELPDHMRPACHRSGHTYPSVYGRIRPDKPAPTITTGFMTMGQGRFVHPHERRTLTAHEGARIQCFPDWFNFGIRSRQAYITLIGNAVPPKLAYVLALELLR
ncbi:MAG: DNA cytosine methyltransferase [Gemmatimonadota bacterium]|nr:DNA cytosine methyltransferase [Gemmatimonadota bacterium]